MFPSKYSLCATILFCQRVYRWGKHFWKQFCESLFSSYIAFLIIAVASQMCSPFDADFSRGNRYKTAEARSGEYGGCSSVFTFFFAKKSLTTTDRCAGALS